QADISIGDKRRTFLLGPDSTLNACLFSPFAASTLLHIPPGAIPMLTRRLLAAFAVLLASGYASAQQPTPQLLSVFPMGAKSGDTVEVTCSGHNLDGSEKLLFSAKGFKSEPVGTVSSTKAQQGQPTSTMKFKVTVPKDANGTHDVRVVSKTGVSNPRA